MYLNSRRGEAWTHSLNMGMPEQGETKQGMAEQGLGLGCFACTPQGCATRMGPTHSRMTTLQGAQRQPTPHWFVQKVKQIRDEKSQ